MTTLPPSPEPVPSSPSSLGNLEKGIERGLYAGRWLLLPLYLGLTVILVLFTLKFVQEVVHIVPHLLETAETDLILTALTLVDLVLVASLIVMVMISSYENFVSRFDQQRTDLSWLGKLDSGSLKIKVASSIVAISSIHLLQVFLNSEQYDTTKLVVLTGIHLAFVLSAVMLGFLERLMAKKKGLEEEPRV